MLTALGRPVLEGDAVLPGSEPLDEPRWTVASPSRGSTPARRCRLPSCIGVGPDSSASPSSFSHWCQIGNGGIDLVRRVVRHRPAVVAREVDAAVGGTEGTGQVEAAEAGARRVGGGGRVGRRHQLGDAPYASRSAAAPATWAAAAEVPLMEVVPPPGARVTMSGAGRRDEGGGTAVAEGGQVVGLVAGGHADDAGVAGRVAGRRGAVVADGRDDDDARGLGSVDGRGQGGRLLGARLKAMRTTSAPAAVACARPSMMAASWPTPLASST